MVGWDYPLGILWVYKFEIWTYKIFSEKIFNKKIPKKLKVNKIFWFI